MEIKYLKKLENNIIIGQKEMRGIPKSEINVLEIEFRISFPKAYKEYLFLSGEYNFLPPYDEIRDVRKLIGAEMKQWFQEELDDANLEIQEPYIVFASSLGQHGFMFFQLNDLQNPKVFEFRYCEGKDENAAEIINYDKSFSEYIDDLVDWEIHIQATGDY